MKKLVLSSLLGVAALMTGAATQVGMMKSPQINPGVTQANIKQTICVPGYTASIRPPTSYTNPLKRKLVAKVPGATMAEYELDHVVPLAVGGAPYAVENLKLQPWPEARVKDRLEVKLQKLVCSGHIKLKTAQELMMNDHWRTAYVLYVGALPKEAR